MQVSKIVGATDTQILCNVSTYQNLKITGPIQALVVSKCHIFDVITCEKALAALAMWRYKPGWVSAPIGRYTVTCLSLGGLEPQAEYGR